MRDMLQDDGRVGILNLAVAACVGLFAAVALVVWGIPGTGGDRPRAR